MRYLPILVLAIFTIGFFAVPDGFTQSTPSVTATAYLNATSPTGVTLHLVGVDLGTGDDGLGVGIYKDGDCYICNVRTFTINHWDQPTWQIPVPVGIHDLAYQLDNLIWEAGTYDVKWDVWSPGESKSQLDSYTWNSASSGTTVTIPAQPQASASATAYLNATSPTDRTLSIVVVDLGTSGQKVITKILKDGVEPPGLDSPTHGTFPLVDWQPTWQIPIPSSWEAGTYDITWDVMTYYPARITSSGSTTVIIPELLPPSVTATAYLNATSPTGVTLSIVGVDLGTGDDGLGVGIYKDGDCYICNLDTIPINHWNQPTWQIPVPLGSESIFGNTWEAGTYDVKWDVKSPGESKSQLDSYTWNSASSGTSVIVPAIPPSVTATAYLNATSPTGRTLNLTGADVGTDNKLPAVLYKDDENGVGYPIMGSGNYNILQPTWQIPIPFNWESGTYAVYWANEGFVTVIGTTSQGSSTPGGGTTVIIPAKPDGYEPIVTVSTDKPSYVIGEAIQISVSVENLDAALFKCDILSIHGECSNQLTGITYAVMSPNGNVVATDQQLLFATSGSNSTTLNTGSLTQEGTYTIDDVGGPHPCYDSLCDRAVADFTQITFGVISSPSSNTPSVTATAYLNATSPTGVTLSIVGVDLGTGDDGLGVGIYKDGDCYICNLDTIPINHWNQPTWQIPVPLGSESIFGNTWEAGTYDVKWDVKSPGESKSQLDSYTWNSASSGTSVIVPALPAEPEGLTWAVINAPGSSTPGCEETNSCFIPNTLTILVGDTVNWQNNDSAAHTATSGTAADGASGHWDSSLIMTGGDFSHTFDQNGTYYYFCMVHPWMQGSVVVGNGMPVMTAEPEPEPEPEPAPPAGVVYNAQGSSTPGCDETNSCFIPNPITIDAGQTVTWLNSDNAAHTATSGTPSAGPDGVWDSSLMMVGGSYSTTFYTTGTHPYFCMVHPWMTGTVIVEGTSEPEPADNTVVETDAEVVTTSDEIIAGSEIQIETDIVNQQSSSQIFAYIVQIKNEYGVPLSISTITGSLGSGQTLTQVISWTPSESGVYVAEIFLWNDLDNANPLSDVEHQYFTVT